MIYEFSLQPHLLFHSRTDLSNDSYSTVNMGLDDGASPHSGRGSYIHSSASPPPYLSSHSPNPAGQGHYSYADNIVYTPLGEFNICRPSESCQIANKNLTIRRQPRKLNATSAGEHSERLK